MGKKINKNQISLAGEFAVLSKLSLLGFDANLTLGNTKGVDILASNPATGKMFKIEVKTSLKKGNYVKNSKDFGSNIEWLLGEGSETNSDKNLFYVFVILAEDGGQRFFIVPSSKVSEYCKREHQVWLSGKGKRKTGGIRTFRIGVDPKFKYPLKTVLEKESEDRWDLIK